MIRVEFVRWNERYSKVLRDVDIKKVLEEIPEKDFKNIKYIYVNFDRNQREKIKRIWIIDLYENEKKVELLDDKYQILDEFCV